MYLLLQDRELPMPEWRRVSAKQQAQVTQLFLELKLKINRLCQEGAAQEEPSKEEKAKPVPIQINLNDLLKSNDVTAYADKMESQSAPGAREESFTKEEDFTQEPEEDSAEKPA